jgi:3-hydroxyacyl-[acyl-carrier-protein] dehydratase
MRLEYFQMVDRILALSIEQGHVRAAATVPTESPVFEGHFPDYPIMPGVLLIECMAQTAGWILLAQARFDRMPFLAAIKNAKLRNFVQPGTRLEIDARVLHEGSGFAVTKNEVLVEGTQVCSAEITFRILPFPASGVRDMLLAAAKRVEFPLEAIGHGQ